MKFATLMTVIFVSIFLVNAANASSGITYTAACTVLTKQSNNSTQHYSNIVVEGFSDEAACELYESRLNASVFPHSGRTGLTPTTIAADCACIEVIDRVKIQF